MDNSETKGNEKDQCVRVAVNVRPLITSELLIGCTDCITVIPGEPQVCLSFFFRFRIMMELCHIAHHDITFVDVTGSNWITCLYFRQCVWRRRLVVITNFQ